MAALATVRDTLPVPAYIGAGAVRHAVWDALHGHAPEAPASDIDVVFFAPDDVGRVRDQAWQDTLTREAPHLAWDVTNQAGVHGWYAASFGRAVPATHSLADSIATWPETATAVAVRLAGDGTLDIVAPLGLDDLMAMVVRFNPARASREQYLARVAQKQYRCRWPMVQVILPNSTPPVDESTTE